jgi:hypothetical protein
MSLPEVSPRSSGGMLLFGIGKAKLVCGPETEMPRVQEYTARIEVGIDRRFSTEVKPGDLVALGPDGSGAVVLDQPIGPWDDRLPGVWPLERWHAHWATDLVRG